MGNCYGVRVKHVSSGSAVSTNSLHKGGDLSSKTSTGKGGGNQDLRLFQGRPAGAGAAANGGSGGGGAQLHAFSYADLRAATRNFRPDSLLGEGGFGSVFKGNIDERTFAPVRPGQGMLIAVKKLNPDGFQGEKEWLAELYFLGALYHPNLVKLIGYCYEDKYRLLVYEFLSRGSLENHLFARNRHTILWTTRLKIAIDAARGLTFLHDAPKPVIYRDFKTSNILLDTEFNAKLSDFGLAKDGPTGDKTHVTTRVVGTYGYAAPEYVATGRLTVKNDVYGFGVVLLEILTGRRAVDKLKPNGEQNLVEWALPYLTNKRKWSRVLDQKLEGQYSLKGAQKAASIALQCLNPDPKTRPTMKEVLESLEPLLNPKDLCKTSITSTSTSIKPSGPTPIHARLKQENKHKHALIPSKQENNEQTQISHQAFKLPSPKEKVTNTTNPSQSFSNLHQEIPPM